MVQDIPPFKDQPPQQGNGQPSCRCPNCGFQEPQQLTVPCYTKKCPRCGTLMTES